MITSSKGGVGKSTVAVNLAWAFARRGLTVLLLDFDLSNRSLDLMLGCADRVVYDIGDLLDRRVAVERAVLRMEDCPGLFFMPGPFGVTRMPTAQEFDFTLAQCESALSPDLVLVDTSGSADRSAAVAAPAMDAAFVIATQGQVAIRAAEASGMYLSEVGIRHIWLVVNRLEPDPARGGRATVRQIIDGTGLPLIGILPSDERMSLLQEQGLTVFAGETCRNSRQGYTNIAARYCGEHVPLFDGFSHINRKKLLC